MKKQLLLLLLISLTTTTLAYAETTDLPATVECSRNSASSSSSSVTGAEPVQHNAALEATIETSSGKSEIDSEAAKAKTEQVETRAKTTTAPKEAPNNRLKSKLGALFLAKKASPSLGHPQYNPSLGGLMMNFTQGNSGATFMY